MSIRLMTYNVHSCRGMDGKTSHERIASVIERYNPDIVALQELDVRRRRSGHLDQTRAIADLVAMDGHFNPALRVEDEEYGDAIISTHPLRLVHAAALPTPPSRFLKERRGALWVEVTIGGASVQIINTHLGLGRNERRNQARALLGEEWLESALKVSPVILCGDFNSRPGGVVHSLLRTRLKDAALIPEGGRNQRTFATTFPFLCLDYVFVSEGIEIRAVEVPRCPLTRSASDHFPMIVDFDLGVMRTASAVDSTAPEERS